MENKDIIGKEILNEIYNHRNDVYKATHKLNSSATAWLRERFMEKSFISFSYGGKLIEDFNLIAITEGSRIQRQAYSSFEDSTTDYEMVDGHMYWGTHYQGNKLDLVLATDGITENLLEDFKYWFQAGVIRELILAEHPNRAIMARMAGAPMLSVLPFKEATSIFIEGKEYKTYTTLYKGTISISFTMEEPFWYSKVNLLGRSNSNIEGGWEDKWTSANNNSVNIFTDLDALKIIKEDGIPTVGMICAPVCLGNDLYVDLDFTTVANGIIAEASTSGSIIIGPARHTDKNNPYTEDNNIPAGVSPNPQNDDVGFIGPRVFTDANRPDKNYSKNDRLYLYYPGSAPSYPTITFTLSPQFDEYYYISSPANSFTNSSKPYNTITCVSTTSTELKFTLPSIYASYNKAIDIFRKASDLTNLVAIKESIRQNVNHRAVRAWAILIIDCFSEYIDVASACTYMSYFFKNTEGNNDIFPATFTIDCKTGRATGAFVYREIDEEQVGSLKTASNNVTFSNFGNISNHEEDVGDMICSNYIKLESRNYPTDDGYIKAYDNRSNINELYGYVSSSKNGYYVKHDCDSDLSNFKFSYKYMYY